MSKKDPIDYELAGKQAVYLLHDLNNYLTILNSSFSLLNKMSTTSENLSEKEKVTLRRGSKGMLELNNLCSTYSLLILNRYTLNFKKYKRSEVFECVMNTLSEGYDLSLFKINIYVCDEEEINTDKPLLLQCLINLLKNAIEHQKSYPDKKLSIVWDTTKLKITNPIDENYCESSSFERGIGLSFVTETSKKLGLTFEVSSDVEFCSTIYFKK